MKKKIFTQKFVSFNFQMGALGCTFSMCHFLLTALSELFNGEIWLSVTVLFVYDMLKFRNLQINGPSGNKTLLKQIPYVYYKYSDDHFLEAALLALNTHTMCLACMLYVWASCQWWFITDQVIFVNHLKNKVLQM